MSRNISSSPRRERQRRDESRRLGGTGTTLLGVYLVGLPVLLAYVLFELWAAPTSQSPSPSRAPAPAEAITTSVSAPAAPGQEKAVYAISFLGLLRFDVFDDARIILIVAAVGALGSYVHAATSFATFVGNRRLVPSWVWWYILRPFIGLSLALVFYFVIRGGLLSAGASSDNLSLYGVAAISGLAGMFSKQLTDKLEEVFTTLFRSGIAGERRDKLGDRPNNPTPQLTSIEPQELAASDPSDKTVTVRGGNFVEDSVLRFGRVNLATTYKNETELTATIPAIALVSPGSVEITAFNPPPGGGTSGPMPITIK